MSDIRPVIKSFRDIMDEVEEIWRRESNGKPIPDGVYKFMWRALRTHFDLLLSKEDIARMDVSRFIQYIREEVTADDYPVDASDRGSKDGSEADGGRGFSDG